MSRMRKEALLRLWNAALPKNAAKVKAGFDGGEAEEYALYEGGGAELVHRYVGGGGLYRLPYELKCRAFCVLPGEEDDCLDGMHARVSALFDRFPLGAEDGNVFCGEMVKRPCRTRIMENGKCEFSCSLCLYLPEYAEKVPHGAPFLLGDAGLVPIEGLLTWKKQNREEGAHDTYKDDGFAHGRRGNALDVYEFSFERCFSAQAQNCLLALTDRSLHGRGNSVKVCTVFAGEDGEEIAEVCPVTVLIGEMDLSGQAPVFSGRMTGTDKRVLLPLQTLLGETGPEGSNG